MMHKTGPAKRERTNNLKKPGRKDEKRIHTLADLDRIHESPCSVIVDAPTQVSESIVRLSLMETGKGIQKRTRPDPIRLLHAARRLRKELLAAGVELDVVKIRSEHKENGDELDQIDDVLKSTSSEDVIKVSLEWDSRPKREAVESCRSWGRGRRLDSGKVIQYDSHL